MEPPSPQAAVGMYPSHHLTVSRTQLPAQHLTLTMSTVELDLPHRPPPTAFLSISQLVQLHPGGKILGLILDSLLSLKLDFQLVSIPVWLVPPGISRF